MDTDETLERLTAIEQAVTELLANYQDGHSHTAALLSECAVLLAEVDASVSASNDTLMEIAWYSLPRWVRWREAWRNRGTQKALKTDMPLYGSERHADGLNPHT